MHDGEDFLSSGRKASEYLQHRFSVFWRYACLTLKANPNYFLDAILSVSQKKMHPKELLEMVI
jgi:hypothetical protein